MSLRRKNSAARRLRCGTNHARMSRFFETRRANNAGRASVNLESHKPAVNCFALERHGNLISLWHHSWLSEGLMVNQMNFSEAKILADSIYKLIEQRRFLPTK